MEQRGILHWRFFYLDHLEAEELAAVVDARWMKLIDWWLRTHEIVTIEVQMQSTGFHIKSLGIGQLSKNCDR